MPDIGVRELKANASGILRQVRERGVQYVVTLRGEPVGVLLPVDAAGEAAICQTPAWDELLTLRAEIGRAWHADKHSTELLGEQRR